MTFRFPTLVLALAVSNPWVVQAQDIEARDTEGLLRDLASPDRKKRLATLQGMTELPRGKAVVTALLRLLRDRDPDIRLTAVQAIRGLRAAAVPQVLAAIRDPSIVKPPVYKFDRLRPPEMTLAAVLAALSSKDNELRREAIIALHSIPDPNRRGLASLQLALKSTDSEIRIETLLTLARYGVHAVEFSRAALNDNDPAVRGMAARVLGQIGPAAANAGKRLVEMCLADTDAGVRVSAIDALSSIQPEGWKGVLRSVILKERWSSGNVLYRAGSAMQAPASWQKARMDVRVLAIFSLSGVGDDSADALTLLRDAATDKNWYVRMASAGAMIDYGRNDPTVRTVVFGLLSDEVEKVRWMAAYGLGQWREHHGQTVMPLARLIRTDSIYVEEAAVKSLRDIGGDAVSVLLRHLAGNEAERRLDAACALGFVRQEGPRVSAALRGALRDGDKRVRAEAAKALARLEANR